MADVKKNAKPAKAQRGQHGSSLSWLKKAGTYVMIGLGRPQPPKSYSRRGGHQ